MGVDMGCVAMGARHGSGRPVSASAGWLVNFLELRNIWRQVPISKMCNHDSFQHVS